MPHTPGTPASSALTPSSGPARYQQIDQGQLDAWRRKGSRNIGFGILWLVAGLLVTVITMSSSAGHHGFYVIAFGPIIGGAIQILSGYRTHRRGTVTPPSPATPSAPAHHPSVSTQSTSSSSRSLAGPAGASRPAAGSSSPGAGTWHPARSITRGMSREELKRRLGEPTKPPSTTAQLHRDATVIGGLSRGTEPTWDKEFWLYQDTPPGHNTEITLDHTRSVEDVAIRPHTDTPDPAPPSAPAPAVDAPRADLASWAEAEGASATADPAGPVTTADLATADKAPTGPAVCRAADTGHPDQADMARANLERLEVDRTRSTAPPVSPPGSGAVATGSRTSGKARRHGWAEELMEEHLTKVEQNTPDLAARASFPLLRRPDVLDYVMSGDRPQWSTGRVGTRGALFDGLYVAVSNVPTHRPSEIRDLLLPEGYNRLLHRLITVSRTIDMKIDVVHWTLGTSPRGWAVHLLYMPPPNVIPLSWDKGVPTLFPWDLFQPEERPQSMRHEF